MILYEHTYNDTHKTDADADAEKATKPSLFARIRRAFAPKMSVWLITQTGDEDAVVYAAPTKKAAFSAANSLVFHHFFPHYSAWLPLHGYERPDESNMPKYGSGSDAWHEYLSANIDAAGEYLSTLEVRRAFYDRRSFAAMLRIMCGVAPLGLDFETDEEVEYWLSTALGSPSEPMGHGDKIHGGKVPEAGDKEGKEEKKEEKPSASLDRQGNKVHNANGPKDDAGARRNPGRPRKKGGSAQKTPGTRKGDPNGN